MNTKSTAVWGLSLGLAALAIGGVAAPAQADPADGEYGELVGVGSDTTQDIMNGIAAAIGDGILASYDATGADFITPREGEGDIYRPNGSSAGREVLRVAIGNSAGYSGKTFNGTSGTWGADAVGKVNFARSSSGASSTDPSGTLTYVPFAVDAVAYATSPDTVIPPLVKGSASDDVDADGVLQTNSLFALYTNKADAVAVDAAGDFVHFVKKAAYTPATGETVHDVTTYIPQAGSGTRSYWIGRFNITEDQISGGTYPNIKDQWDADGDGTVEDDENVQEHDGAAVENDPYAITPFSVGQWIAQGNGVEGVTDRRHNAVIGVLGGVDPVLGTEGSYSLNPSYNGTVGYTRNVFNIVPSAEADDPTSLIHEAFVGTDSLVCQQTTTIQTYGFGLLTGTGANACGDTSTRAYPPVASSIAVGDVASVKFGSKLTIPVTVGANSNAGGTVEFTLAGTEDVVGTAVVPFGESAVDAKISTDDLGAGDFEFDAAFIPALSGQLIAETAAPIAVEVKKASSETKATADSVKVKKTPKVEVKVKAGGADVQGDKVKVKDGDKTVGKGKLDSKGKVTIKIDSYKKAGSYKLKVKYQGSSNVKSSKDSVTLKVKK